MKDTGELQLNLPALPKGWRWRAHITDDSVRVEAHQILWDATHGPMYGYVYVGMDLKFTRHAGYDLIIESVQEEVDAIYDRVKHHRTKELGKEDALSHIAQKFIESIGHNLDAV